MADGWRKWWPTIEASAQHVSELLVELAGVQNNHKVLDVATGIGEPAVTAAGKVGSGGQVIATDQSAGMLAIARERAAQAGLDNIEFREVDGEALNLPDESFDAVLCRWGLMFMPNVAGAIKGFRDLLVPGGKFATAVWGVPADVPALSMPMGVIKAVLNPPPPPAEAPTLFKLGTPGLLDQAFMDGGLTVTGTESTIVEFNFKSSQDYVSFLQEIASPIIALVGQPPVDKQAKVWEGIKDSAEKFAKPDGTISIPNVCLVMTGVRNWS
ncbi:MAG: class I SAM-dependent methyltransferase [Candidatus Marinimicrobia bacterium]|nr:class I SAM-dependent methyltransferase [Candidatus Neomarinimicrobiota bacterium]